MQGRHVNRTRARQQSTAPGAPPLQTLPGAADTYGDPHRERFALAETAEALQEPQPGEQDGKIVALRPEGTISVDRRAEGGLTLQFSFDIPRLPKLRALPTWTHQQLVNGALIAAVVLLSAFIVYKEWFAGAATSPAYEEAAMLRPNVATDFNPSVESPVVAAGAYVDKLASVIGNVSIGAQVFVAPFASIRGDEGQPIVIGAGSNVQDGVVVHALETFSGGKPVDKNLVDVNGKKYAVYIGSGVSLAHQSQVHGPAAVGDHTFVGMQALVFKSVIGKNVVIEPGAKLIGVTVAEGRYVPAGSVVTKQSDADALPLITESYPFATLNAGVLHVNEAFADAYLELTTGGGTPAAPAAPSTASAGH